MLYIGIDNGSSGGIAVLNSEGRVVRADKMPLTDAELLALLEAISPSSASPHRAEAMLEHAQAFPKMGVTGAFTYGGGYRAMQMALTAVKIPFDIVVPRKWQAAIGCLSGGDKNVTKRRAQQLFPGITVTHAIADALLIAEYGRRMRLSYERGREGERDGKEEEKGQGQATGAVSGGRRWKTADERQRRTATA